MAMHLNEATLIGNLGKDPETRTTQGGEEVVSFSVATTERWKRDGQAQERTEWHNVVVWQKGAVALAKGYLRKGSTVWLRGKLQTRKWQDKDGRDRWSTEIVLSQSVGELRLLDKRADGAGGGSAGAAGSGGGSGAAGWGGAPAQADLDDDVPF